MKRRERRGGKKLKARQDQLIAKERKLDKKRNWGKRENMRWGGRELCIRQLIIPQSNHSFSLTVALSASRFCLRSFFSVFFFVTYL